jgi:hypothetical protein
MSVNEAVAKPWVVLVGGFLGAGKTTLLMAAANELQRRGLRPAVILNDQGTDLVDTQLASLQGVTSGEVIGGCFCCRLSDLLNVMERLRGYAPDVIFAEPVGSCTDISATILAPLRDYQASYRLAPYTVLVDPSRAETLLQRDADPDLAFLFRKQLEEADLVCFTKADLAHPLPDLPLVVLRNLSARTGDGVAAWLDDVLSGTLSAGSTTLDINYEQYAQAEAALAWLNLQATLRPDEPLTMSRMLGRLLDQLDTALSESGIQIVHLKGIASSLQGYVKAAICSNGQPPVVEGDLASSPTEVADLLINLRAVGPAVEVRRIVEQTLQAMDYRAEHLHVSCFHPAAPKPERRIPALV